MMGFWQDLRLALRTVRKQPGFTLTAAITLALGIGANTVIFSVINALILNRPNFAEAENVVALWRTAKDKRSKGPASYLDLQELNSQTRSLQGIAGYKSNPFTVLDEQAERIQGMRVTANFLSVLKVAPALGRDFRVEEEKRGAKGVVIISDEFWRIRLAGDQSAVGKEITLDGKPFTVIGVLPAGFEFPLCQTVDRTPDNCCGRRSKPRRAWSASFGPFRSFEDRRNTRTGAGGFNDHRCQS
jgi:hypothetical protein